LYNVLFELSSPFLILLIPLIPQLFDSQQKVIDVFGAIGVSYDRHVHVCVRHRLGMLQSMDYCEEGVLIYGTALSFRFQVLQLRLGSRDCGTTVGRKASKGSRYLN